MADLGLANWISIVMAFFAPAVAYLHTVGAAPLKPRPEGVLSGPIMRWFLTRIWLVLFFNGSCFAAALLIYNLTGGSALLVIPLLLSLPAVVVQFIFVGEARAQWITGDRKQRKQ